MIAVADASPLIGRGKVGRLQLLPRLYDRVLIPYAVYDDVVVRGRGRSGARDVKNAVTSGWLEVVAVQNPSRVLPPPLGTGEDEAIVLAVEQRADVVIVDDRAARRECDRRGIIWLTTGDVLLDARLSGYIRTLKPVLDRMERLGFGVWNYADLLRAAGE